MNVLVVPIWQIMANDGGDEDAEWADAADDGCEGAMGTGSNCYDYERGSDYYYDDDDGQRL